MVLMPMHQDAPMPVLLMHVLLNTAMAVAMASATCELQQALYVVIIRIGSLQASNVFIAGRPRRAQCF